MRDLLRDEKGQAVVEYVLMLAVTLTTATVLAVGLRKILFGVWEDITQKTVGGSPLAPPQIKYRLGR